MPSPRELALIFLLAWNILVFLLYAHDKHRARIRGRRVSERSLLLAATLFGAVGALCGIYGLRHKTRYRRFALGVPLLLLLQLGCVLLLACNKIGLFS